MDAIMELILTILGEVLSGMKYRNPRRRTWVLTGFFSVLALLLEAFLIWHTVRLFQQGSTIGTAILGAFTLAALVVCSVIIVRGHKRNWDHF